jgi:hypothetical protein
MWKGIFVNTGKLGGFSVKLPGPSGFDLASDRRALRRLVPRWLVAKSAKISNGRIILQID